MEYRIQHGHRHNSKLYLVGENAYVINKLGANGTVYLRCRHHAHCKGTAKLSGEINLVEEIRPHTCESTDDHTAYLPYLERMRELATSTQFSLKGKTKTVRDKKPVFKVGDKCIRRLSIWENRENQVIDVLVFN